MLKTFRDQGYHIVTLKMNTKDYGIPHNRDRIFIVGFLDSNQYHDFKPPVPFELTTKLKDMLCSWIPEKYFLSQTMIDGFMVHKNRHEEKGNGFQFKPTDGNKVASCINTVPGNKATDNFIKVKSFNPNSQANKICEVSKNDYFHTLTAGTKGYANGYVKIDLKQVGNIDKKGHNSLWGRVYDIDGIASTQNANGGGAGAKTGLYFIKSNTKDGYEIAKDYDCIDFSNASSLTRRGRVGKGYAQCLATQSNIGVIYNFMIRRLIPYECFLLQGLKPQDIVLVNSDTQSYKIAGNAQSVNVLQQLLRALYKKEENKQINSLFDYIEVS